MGPRFECWRSITEGFGLVAAAAMFATGLRPEYLRVLPSAPLIGHMSSTKEDQVRLSVGDAFGLHCKNSSVDEPHHAPARVSLANTSQSLLRFMPSMPERLPHISAIRAADDLSRLSSDDPARLASIELIVTFPCDSSAVNIFLRNDCALSENCLVLPPVQSEVSVLTRTFWPSSSGTGKIV
eukprot:scaffold787_cov63-Phaeocystis_antarctica.AAC.4